MSVAEDAETLLVCPACMQGDGRRGADPNCKACEGAGMVSSKRAAELRASGKHRVGE